MAECSPISRMPNLDSVSPAPLINSRSTFKLGGSTQVMARTRHDPQLEQAEEEQRTQDPCVELTDHGDDPVVVLSDEESVLSPARPTESSEWFEAPNPSNAPIYLEPEYSKEDSQAPPEHPPPECDFQDSQAPPNGPTGDLEELDLQDSQVQPAEFDLHEEELNSGAEEDRKDAGLKTAFQAQLPGTVSVCVTSMHVCKKHAHVQMVHIEHAVIWFFKGVPDVKVLN